MKTYILPLILSALLILIGLIIAKIPYAIDNTKNQNTYEACCEGNPCTDTYYTPEDNLCHLTICENMGMDDCTYEGNTTQIYKQYLS